MFILFLACEKCYIIFTNITIWVRRITQMNPSEFCSYIIPIPFYYYFFLRFICCF